MEIQKTTFKGLLVITPRVFSDARGYFLETYTEEKLKNLPCFVQDNESLSVRGTLRGMHYQIPPHAQGKLIRVIRGEILDIVVDLRSDSLTFGQYFSLLLNGESKTILYIPPGFAHGFLALSEEVLFSYKCTAPYNPANERGIRWDDPDLRLPWDCKNPILAPKDQKYPSFADLQKELQQWKEKDWLLKIVRV